ncbi:RNA-binding protein [Trypanosoma grayi]|uniref:RNA-binding protein n=1 Tax=Trypanosoma grayi TaxID=71804 RepID=UPI0004F41ED6|nr:RNA-binding protein [Trypanosoma grayi]KEG09680.1 RNA-binding protein [Trypanosoma grayi]
MRALTEDETRRLFDKLAQYIGPNTAQLLQRRGEAEPYVFRLHRSRVWHMPQRLARLASCVAKSNLMGIGVLVAKVTHNGHMRIQVTALDYIAQYALFKVWVKPNQEQKFLYGGHVTRAGLGRITEATPKYQKVAVFSMGDVPLGFGVAALGTLECRKCEMNATVLFHEADVGEYLRNEAKLT